VAAARVGAAGTAAGDHRPRDPPCTRDAIRASPPPPREGIAGSESLRACLPEGGERRARVVARLGRLLVDDGQGDRYALASALDALRALADARDAEAGRLLLDTLFSARWCPHTTASSQY